MRSAGTEAWTIAAETTGIIATPVNVTIVCSTCSGTVMVLSGFASPTAVSNMTYTLYHAVWLGF